MSNLDQWVDTLLKRADMLCWPALGSGYALMRIIQAHDTYLYFPEWNNWGPVETPLVPAKTPPLTDHPHWDATMFTAHQLTIFGECVYSTDQSLRDQLITWFSRYQFTDRDRRWMQQWINSNTRVVLPVQKHVAASEIVNLTSCPIIQMFYRDPLIFSQRDIAVSDSGASYSSKYAKHHESQCINHSKIFNCSIEDMFFSDYSTFLREYTQLRNWLQLENRSEQIWAFILYYRDRVTRPVIE